MRKKPSVKLSLLDKAIGYVSPGSLTKRVQAKASIEAAKQMGYITPGSPKKTMKGVIATANSPHTDIAPKLNGSRAISRDMAMNTPLATSALGRMCTNVVGWGLSPQIMPDWEALDISPEEAAKWAKKAEQRFGVWAGSKESDYTGLYDFYDNQAIAFMATLLNGDNFFTLPWRKNLPAKGNAPWELQVQLIEADLVRDPCELVLGYGIGKDIVSGVEFKNGRVAAYHVANYYPERRWIDGQQGKNLKFVRVPIFDTTGRRNIYHMLPPGNRVGQRRGVGLLAPVVDMLKTLSRYSESYLVGELVSNLFTVFVKDMSATGALLNEGFTPDEVLHGGGTVTGPDGEQVQLMKDPDSALDIEMGSGNIVYLDDDKEIQFADPKRDPSGFKPFFEAMVKQISAAIEMPQEQLLLEFNTSYSSARAALLEAWKMYKKRRIWLQRNFCQPILEAFIEEEVAKGNIKAPGFLEDLATRKAWTTAAWVGPGQGQIDPLKEAKASVMKIQNHLSNYEDEFTADKGGSWANSMAKQKAAVETLKEYDLLTEADDRETNTEELPGPTGTDPVKEIK